MEKPHLVMLPYPTHGHINPMLQLATLFHSKGFYITFINTESSQQSFGPKSPVLEDFQYETIPDGVLISSSRSSQQRVVKSCLVTYDDCAAPLKELLVRLSNSSGLPRISCVVYNWLMGFALDVTEELRIPAFVFSTMSACGYLADLHLAEVIRRGYAPLKDESCLTNGYLDTPIHWIPGMKDIRLRDLSSFIRTVDGDDLFLNSGKVVTLQSLKAQGLIINTFDSLETEVLNSLRTMFREVHALGPLSKLLGHCKPPMRLNLWEEDRGCIEWLDTQKKGSVIYVSFGSITTISKEQFIEFAWGIANCKQPFLWVLRPDLVDGDFRAALPKDFMNKTGEGYCISWCPQEAVLSHSSVGGFLTHCGWNSILEAICGGVPMICWPGFGEQYTNARYICKEWGIGMEVEEVKREKISSVLKELMEGEKGKEMRRNVLKWKERATAATMQGGSSSDNVEKFVEGLVNSYA